MKMVKDIQYRIIHDCKRFSLDFYIDAELRYHVPQRIINEILETTELVIMNAVEDAEHFSRFSISDDELPLRVNLVVDVNKVNSINIDQTREFDFDNGGGVYTSGRSPESFKLALDVFGNACHTVRDYINSHYSKLIISFFIEGKIIFSRGSVINSSCPR